MKDVEKVKAVHDYIVINTKYDIKGLENDNLLILHLVQKECLKKEKPCVKGMLKHFSSLWSFLISKSKHNGVQI